MSVEPCSPKLRLRQLSSGTWVRDYADEWTTGGDTVAVHLANRDDTSPYHQTYPQGYDGRCGPCALNISHSVALHEQRLAEAIENGWQWMP